MGPALKRLAKNVPSRHGEHSEFNRWLFVEASTVIAGEKTGTLLVLNARRFLMNMEQLTANFDRLCTQWRLSYVILCRCQERAKVIVYNPDLMQQDLKQVPRWVLRHLEYPEDVNPQDFLDHIGRRWQTTGSIPHEIGLCLGYPLKDVLGFMGLVDLPCTGGCGWRIYGRPNASIVRSHRYRDVRYVAERLINTRKAA